ncbi:MAG: hypothetical protein Q7U04_13575 [Bacteriovorax sp.]|nr:hypothetical protein [Bacteriovorax sp.]
MNKKTTKPKNSNYLPSQIYLTFGSEIEEISLTIHQTPINEFMKKIDRALALDFSLFLIDLADNIVKTNLDSTIKGLEFFYEKIESHNSVGFNKEEFISAKKIISKQFQNFKVLYPINDVLMEVLKDYHQIVDTLLKEIKNDKKKSTIRKKIKADIFLCLAIALDYFEIRFGNQSHLKEFEEYITPYLIKNKKFFSEILDHRPQEEPPNKKQPNKEARKKQSKKVTRIDFKNFVVSLDRSLSRTAKPLKTPKSILKKSLK